MEHEVGYLLAKNTFIDNKYMTTLIKNDSTLTNCEESKDDIANQVGKERLTAVSRRSGPTNQYTSSYTN